MSTDTTPSTRLQMALFHGGHEQLWRKEIKQKTHGHEATVAAYKVHGETHLICVWPNGAFDMFTMDKRSEAEVLEWLNPAKGATDPARLTTPLTLELM